MPDNQMERIKKLIRKGFDLELISFELDIPMEKLQEGKKQVEKENQDKIVENNNNQVQKPQKLVKPEVKLANIEYKDNKPQSRMQQMRNRYNRLYYGTNQNKSKSFPMLKREEMEQIDLTICEIEEVVKDIEGKSRAERRRGANTVLKNIKQIEDYQLTVEQADKLYVLLKSDLLEDLKRTRTDNVDTMIMKKRKLIMKKLIDAIDIAQTQTEEIEELEDLRKKLTTKLEPYNSVWIERVKNKIKNKILNIKQKETFDRIRNDVPVEIESVIRNLAAGTLDIQEANEIIEKEAKKRKENKLKNKFVLTEEQEKRQILIQIKKVLMNKAEQYYIENPETTIAQLQELSGGEMETAIRTVVKNLTATKDFERAKETCAQYPDNNKKSQFAMYIRKLKKEIRNDEISSIVLQGINMNGTDEEEKTYFNFIEKGLNSGNVNIKSISLGKSQDGSRTITLADVWKDTNEKQRF